VDFVLLEKRTVPERPARRLTSGQRCALLLHYLVDFLELPAGQSDEREGKDGSSR
jgi:hypothetical protein